MTFISSADKFFLLVGLLFSFLIAVAAAGTTYSIMYEEQDKRYQRKEVIRSGIAVFVLCMLFTCLLVFVLPRFIN